MVHLLVAHPGHELLLFGWMSRHAPVVSVLTDGSAYDRPSRLHRTTALLQDAGARPGTIFGRFTDREAYALILDGNAGLLFALAEELAAQLVQDRPAMIVTDAAEGYNPVHDLCRLIAGAAIVLSGLDITHLEYAVVGHPQAFDPWISIDLDAAEYASKLDHARAYGASLNDVDDLLLRHGPDAFRRESLRRVAEWTALDDSPVPLYERFGEERISAGRYARVIRRNEHLRPLRDALCAAVEERSCVS